MYRSYDTVEDQLHALLLPNIRKIELFSHIESHRTNLGVSGVSGDDKKEDIDGDMAAVMRDGHMPLLKSLLSIFDSSAMVFEQFARNKNFSSMAMVLTLSSVVGGCLQEETLHKLMARYTVHQERLIKTKKSKISKEITTNLDLRQHITKSLMSLCSQFPFEYVDKKRLIDFNEDEDAEDENQGIYGRIQNEDGSSSDDEDMDSDGSSGDGSKLKTTFFNVYNLKSCARKVFACFYSAKKHVKIPISCHQV